MIVKATYVSVWDGGIEVRTNCMYNGNTKEVFDIEISDVDGLDILEDEYVELLDGEKVVDFINKDYED